MTDDKRSVIDFADWDASQEELDKMNEKLASEMRHHAQLRNTRAELSEVIIEDGAMSFKFRSPRMK